MDVFYYNQLFIQLNKIMFKINEKQLRPPSPIRSPILDKITLQSTKLNRYSDTDKKFREKYADIHFKSIYDIPTPIGSNSFSHIEHTQDKIRRLKSQREVYKSNEKKQKDDSLQLKRKVDQQIQDRKKDKRDLENKLEDFAIKILKHCNQIVDKNLQEMINVMQTTNKKHEQCEKEDIQTVFKILAQKQRGQFKSKFISYQDKIKELSNNYQNKFNEIDSIIQKFQESIQKVQNNIPNHIPKIQQISIDQKSIQKVVNQIIIKKTQQQRTNNLHSLQTLLSQHIQKLQQKILQEQHEIQNRIQQWQSKIQIEIQQISKDDQLENIKLTVLKLHPIVTEIYTSQQQIKEEIKGILDKISIQSNKLTLLGVQLNQYKQHTLETLKDFKCSITNRVQNAQKNVNVTNSNLNKLLHEMPLKDKQYENKFEKILEQFMKIQIDMRELKGVESLNLSKSYKPEFGQNSHFDFDKLMGLKVSKQSSFVFGEDSLKENSREIHQKSHITNSAINEQNYEDYLGIPTLKKGSSYIIEQQTQNNLEKSNNIQNIAQPKAKQQNNFQLTQPPDLKNLPEQNQFHLEDLANHARQFFPQNDLDNILMTSSMLEQDPKLIEEETSVDN